jgi:hypothetical protein
MVTRRSLLKSTAAGTAIGAGLVASTSSTITAGASFGDGVNLQPSYYCQGKQDLGWDLMGQQPEIDTVRIEIEPPNKGEGEARLYQARRWIRDANDNGYNVIATYHHYPNNGSDDTNDLQAAAEWWVSNYGYLSDNGSTPFTINLHNEWGSHDLSAYDYGQAYDSAVSRVRDSNYSGMIICDVPGYAQEPQIAADAFGYISDDDIAFSVHVYAKAYNSYTSGPLKPAHLDYLDDNQPYPCLLGEFGPLGPDDRTDWSTVVDHAKSLGWPVIGWAWNGDSSNDPMNMSSPFWGDDCGATSYSTTSYFDTVYDKLGSGGGDTSTHHLNAEYYSLDGVSTATNRSGYWGDAYVTGFDDAGDSVTMSFDSAASGDRTVEIRYAAPYGDKMADLSINGDFQQQVSLAETTSFTRTTAGTFSFEAGTNRITITKGWGYYDIDAVIVK